MPGRIRSLLAWLEARGLGPLGRPAELILPPPPVVLDAPSFLSDGGRLGTCMPINTVYIRAIFALNISLHSPILNDKKKGIDLLLESYMGTVISLMYVKKYYVGPSTR